MPAFSTPESWVALTRKMTTSGPKKTRRVPTHFPWSPAFAIETASAIPRLQKALDEGVLEEAQLPTDPSTKDWDIVPRKLWREGNVKEVDLIGQPSLSKSLEEGDDAMVQANPLVSRQGVEMVEMPTHAVKNKGGGDLCAPMVTDSACKNRLPHISLRQDSAVSKPMCLEQLIVS
ncbi:hypothetical protein FDECE_16418 [Fusarium decemcellulare]|nr:hypothetical protein FDECE_16418 [Fusarium decemcellulare]